MRHLIHRTAWYLSFLAIGCGLLGIFLRVTFRDSSIYTAPVFYALPLPVCAAAFFVGAIFASLKSRQIAIIAIMCCSFTGIRWLATSYQFGPDIPETAASDLRIAVWNASENKRLYSHSLKMLKGLDVDVIAFAETGRSKEDAARIVKENPEFQFRPAFGFTSLLSKGRVTLTESHRMPNDSIAHVFETTIRGEKYRVILADLGPKPLFPRKGILQQVLEIVGENPKRTVLLGDFNTPYESVWFDAYRERMEHAFQSSGSGIRETWPWMLPALSLDHIWVSRDLEPLACRKKVGLSDHAMVFTVLKKR